MYRFIVAFSLLATLVLAPATPADAAPSDQQGCLPTAFAQPDMAGIYVSVASQMKVQIYPCGGIYVQWDNLYGTHAAAYRSVDRLPGGGVVAVPMTASLMRLDSVDTIAFKPGIPGTIEVWTVNAYAQVVGIYTLQKMS